MGPGNNHHPEGWTDARVAKLSELHDLGWSYGEIARALGHVTRNAVCGKINRLGLARTPEQSALNNSRGQLKRIATMTGEAVAAFGQRPPKRAAEPKPPAPAVRHMPARPRPTPPRLVVVEKPEPAPSRPVVPFEALKPSGCKFPIGTPGRPSFGYCGERQAIGKPYCPACCRIAYQPMSPHQRRQAYKAALFFANRGRA